jgi:uncharacterized membrane protein YeaQ/YmgE (transglycosylase-associated protein family)
LVEGDLAALARQRRLRLIVFAVLGVGLAVLFGWTRPSASPAKGTLSHWLVLGGFALSGLSLSALAFGLALPAGRRLKPAIGLGVVAGLGLLAVMISHDPAHAVPVTHGVGCLAKGAGIAVALVALAGLFGRKVLRRHAPTGLLLGVGAGLIGVIPIHIACPVLDPVHLLVWHGMVPVLSGAVVALLWSLFTSR